jgi:hypothetical protein
MIKYNLRNRAKENNRTDKPGQIFIRNRMQMGKPSGIKTVQN